MVIHSLGERLAIVRCRFLRAGTWGHGPPADRTRTDVHVLRGNMSFKKTDLVKQMARKIDGRQKSSGVPHRFAQGAAGMASQRDQPPRDSPPRAVAINCKLPPELAKRLRERALVQEGGLSAVVAQALTHWLATPP